jgi:hypothetical protein
VMGSQRLNSWAAARPFRRNLWNLDILFVHKNAVLILNIIWMRPVLIWSWLSARQFVVSFLYLIYDPSSYFFLSGWRIKILYLNCSSSLSCVLHTTLIWSTLIWSLEWYSLELLP